MENPPVTVDPNNMPYSNREIDEWRTDVRKDLADILVQTTKHNGRMSKIELRQAYTTGAVAVLVLIVLPILGWALFQIVSLPNQIHVQVQAAIIDALQTPKK